MKYIKIKSIDMGRNEIKIKNDKLKKELSKCCICYENNVNVIFLPCGHICCCENCTLSIIKCPLCRELVLYKKFCQFKSYLRFFNFSIQTF